jgi:hypothetical protein
MPLPEYEKLRRKSDGAVRYVTLDGAYAITQLMSGTSRVWYVADRWAGGWRRLDVTASGTLNIARRRLAEIRAKGGAS